ncbi:HAUS augmin-like complex subunit 5 isoform X2 [Haliaeetus albicilla]|uniref:HAUS augmin-like complex subunit 5 isoform X2 n=1 Tax=Haliaeetus albicilla TaxID=8969 RepID=UPI0037E77DD7
MPRASHRLPLRPGLRLPSCPAAAPPSRLFVVSAFPLLSPPSRHGAGRGGVGAVGGGRNGAAAGPRTLRCRSTEAVLGVLRPHLGIHHPPRPTPTGAGPAPPEGALPRLRQEVEGLGAALGGAQEAALELEAELGAGQSRRGAELRRGLELRLMGAAAARAGQRLRAGRGALDPPPGRWEAGPELEAAVAVGVEPEVLVSVRAVCRMRAEALEAGLEPRPPEETRDPLGAANERWLRAAKAVLSSHAPGAVLWALECLARERTRPPRPRKSDLDPDLDPEAPPTVKTLIEESWGAVGGLWARLPPLATRLPPLRLRLSRLRRRLAQRLGGDPKTQDAARLALEVAWLTGARGALHRGVQKLRGGGDGDAPPKFFHGGTATSPAARPAPADAAAAPAPSFGRRHRDPQKAAAAPPGPGEGRGAGRAGRGPPRPGAGRGAAAAVTGRTGSTGRAPPAPRPGSSAARLPRPWAAAL